MNTTTTPNGIDRATALCNMLETVLEQANTEESIEDNIGELAKGLAAYDAWIAAFQGEKIVPFFNAYNAAVYSELRQFAVQFLRSLKEELKEYEWECLSDAFHHYEAIAAALEVLSHLFPFPEGGDPKDVKNVEKAVQLLQNAKQAEEKGLMALTQLYEAITKNFNRLG